MAVDPFGNGTDDDETRDAESFLSGGGSISAKFPKVGYTFEGTITGWSMRQQTDMKTGELLFWVGKKRKLENEMRPTDSRKNPVMQLLLEVQSEATFETWETKEYIPVPLEEDDGMRTLYVKGNLQTAINKAKKEAGGKLEKGAYISVTRTQSSVRKGAEFASHNFTAVWTKASDNAKAADALMEEDPFADAE